MKNYLFIGLTNKLQKEMLKLLSAINWLDNIVLNTPYIFNFIISRNSAQLGHILHKFIKVIITC